VIARDPGSIRSCLFDKLCWIIGLGVLVRLVFIGFLNLLPEEAYYWNYARHLDIGYLDHPPMVAWLISASEAILGRSELAVRMPAFLGWFALAYFMFRLSKNTVGEESGKVVTLLLAVLPIYMSAGFLMTPDAPFYVCWAGALFFLSQALFREGRHAWYGTGIFLGLGLLSKYTMGLIVPAAVAFMLLDKNSRHWFRKPQPYVAMLVALVLFSPVVIWNSQHQWASFVFQGADRWTGGVNFHLHILIGSMLVLLTPLGLYEAIRAGLDFFKQRVAIRRENPLQYRKSLFLVTFTMVPLLVFVIHSIQGQPKLNWTGPVWLALLPLIGLRISVMKVWQKESSVRVVARPWFAAAVVLLVIFIAGFGYMIAGMPGLTKDSGMKFPIAWKECGDRIEEIETTLERDTGVEPIIIGLDSYWLASEASFYDPDGELHADSLPEIAGQNLIGENSLMWNLWVRPEAAHGRPGLLVSFTADKLEQKGVTDRFSRVGAITKEVLRNRSGETGHFYWRIGYDYRGTDPRTN